jgi:hypothetical protein
MSLNSEHAGHGVFQEIWVVSNTQYAVKESRQLFFLETLAFLKNKENRLKIGCALLFFFPSN